jgi:hypothetical protein
VLPKPKEVATVSKVKTVRATSLPHSWRLAEWPPFIFPNKQNAAKHLLRTHRSELLACGALIRIGRDLVVLGEGYAQFLARKAKRVEGYNITGQRHESDEAAA